MIASPQVELATPADLDSLMRLRVAQGWHRSEPLLRAIVGWEHGRLFIIREATLNPASPTPDAPIVATSAIAAGTVGAIGNVIVHADYRRRGLGRVIMQAALDWLRDYGVRSVQLDATVDGRPLYTRLGFAGDTSSWFAHGPVAALNRTLLVTRSGSIHAATSETPGADTLARLASLDATAYGGDRTGFLALILRRPTTWLYVAEDPTGMPTGYALLSIQEPPDRRLHLGPWVAADHQSAAALLAAILREDAPWRAHFGEADTDAELFLSFPGTNRHTHDLVAVAGGRLVEDDLIMQLDFDDSGLPTPATEPRRPVASHPDRLYSWLAPMVF